MKMIDKIIIGIGTVVMLASAIVVFIANGTQTENPDVYNGELYDEVQEMIDKMESAELSPDYFKDSTQNLLGSLPPADEEPWNLILVNRENPIPDNFTVETVEIEGGERVDKRIAEALREMLAAAETDGFYGKVVSGYRDAAAQQTELDAKAAALVEEGFSEEDAADEAARWVAAPGTSEHETGLAVDINADGVHSAGYEVYGWLAENAYKYGFICRYTSDKQIVTGFSPEPWHYRYVGVEDARAMYEGGLCLEEYLEQINSGETDEE